jgi:hypothetical protein
MGWLKPPSLTKPDDGFARILSDQNEFFIDIPGASRFIAPWFDNQTLDENQPGVIHRERPAITPGPESFQGDSGALLFT